MLYHYIKMSLRQLVRNKLFGFINIFGLSAAFSTCLIIGIYIHYELSYNQHHANKDRIYRIVRHHPDGEKSPGTPYPVADLFQREIPGVEKSVRVSSFLAYEGVYVHHQQDFFPEKNVICSEPSLFDIFTIPIIQGSHPDQAFQDITHIYISERLAHKYFQKSNSIGQNLTLRHRFGFSEFTIKGIFKNIPKQSYIQADLILPLEFIAQKFGAGMKRNWNSNGFETYVLMSNNQHITESQIDHFKESHKEELNKGNDDNYYRKMDFELQPLMDIHLHSDFYNHPFTDQGDIKRLYVLGSVAILILVIAIINFVLLSTSKSIKRSKDIGIRRIVGARKSEIYRQLVTEYIILVSFSLIFSILFTHLLLPHVCQLMQRELSLEVINSPSFYIFLTGFILVTGISSSLFIILNITRFNPLDTIKNKIIEGKRKVAFKGSLIVIQMFIFTILIFACITINYQLHFIQNKSLGFDKENLLEIKLSHLDYQVRKTIKSELKKLAIVKSIGSASYVPGSRNYYNAKLTLTGTSEKHSFEILFADKEIINTLGLDILDGWFKEEAFNNGNYILLNQTGANLIFKNKKQGLIGKNATIDWWNVDGEKEIMGIVNDFHLHSLYDKIQPLVLLYNPQNTESLIARLNPGNLTAMINQIENTWKKVIPDAPFKYSFIDQNLDNEYRSEMRLAMLINYFTFLSIIIAGLGLFGLTSIFVQQRTKEIGIRKIIGASFINIIILLSKKMVQWGLLAFVVAIPAGYQFVQEWLNNFAYRIEINVWLLLITGVLSFVLMLLTTGLYTLKAALANPVEALRNE